MTRKLQVGQQPACCLYTLVPSQRMMQSCSRHTQSQPTDSSVKFPRCNVHSSVAPSCIVRVGDVTCCDKLKPDGRHGGKAVWLPAVPDEALPDKSCKNSNHSRPPHRPVSLLPRPRHLRAAAWRPPRRFFLARSLLSSPQMREESALYPVRHFDPRLNKGGQRPHRRDFQHGATPALRLVPLLCQILHHLFHRTDEPATADAQLLLVFQNVENGRPPVLLVSSVWKAVR
mmetsp:Transcript_24941/g.50610  ORF Transcript_24941/g.50610 Transcript_24941/m.50610 type:complete len:229 (+) Transcript_24941:256-942(+)